MFYKIETNALVLSIKVSANAQRSEFKKQRVPDVLDVRVQGVRDKGRANESLVAYLASTLNIPQSHIEIFTGATTPHKKIRLKCEHPEKVLRQIQELIALKT